MPPSANIGRVLWPKKAKTNEVAHDYSPRALTKQDGKHYYLYMAVEFDSDQKKPTNA
jgi:hypothetical protein